MVYWSILVSCSTLVYVGLHDSDTRRRLPPAPRFSSQMSLMSPPRFSDYDAFARVYNDHWGPDSARRFWPAVRKLLLKDLPVGARILDLCCGTGQLARILTLLGYRVTGLDGSEGMLHYARINAPEAEFILEDARSFRLPPEHDAVVSTFDSLNHVMNLEELTQVFRNVRACLKEGGVFLFDLNMEDGFRWRWRGSFGVVEEEYVFVVRARFDTEKKLGEMDLTLFSLEDNAWRRSDMKLWQRCYSIEEVRSALEAAEFTDIQTFDALNDLKWEWEIGRTFFRCKKGTRRSNATTEHPTAETKT